jgi:hypothetical protein
MFLLKKEENELIFKKKLNPQKFFHLFELQREPEEGNSAKKN